jgi:hypothetical protein
MSTNHESVTMFEPDIEPDSDGFGLVLNSAMHAARLRLCIIGKAVN